MIQIFNSFNISSLIGEEKTDEKILVSTHNCFASTAHTSKSEKIMKNIWVWR